MSDKSHITSYQCIDIRDILLYPIDTRYIVSSLLVDTPQPGDIRRSLNFTIQIHVNSIVSSFRCVEYLESEFAKLPAYLGKPKYLLHITKHFEL